MTNKIQTRSLSSANSTVGLIRVLANAVIKAQFWRRRARWRRELQRLDICQLRDAGIDPMLARGGRASTASMVRFANLASLR